MTKTKKIIIIIVTVVLLAAFFIWVLLPRIIFKSFADKYLDDCFDVKGSYFEAENYSVTNDSYVTVSNKYISLDIPADLVPYNDFPDENGYPRFYFTEPKTSKSLCLLQPSTDKFDITDPAYTEGMENEANMKVALEELIEAIESFGNGIPDSKYNTYKAIYLLEREDNSFWNFNKAVGFNTLGSLRAISVNGYESVYIYETDDICGTVLIEKDIDEEKGYSGYSAVFDAYLYDDLNTNYTVMINMESLEEIYAVINSVEIISAA
ncbi:MAG: hypothetical protein IJ446_08005 [Oscillospiraceae bacterium]|nr:hypothetical protein [Oscillospiraceae bacterium]